MCVGIPVLVVHCGEVMASCLSRNGEEQVNMLLIGEQPPGTWVLSFLGWAREVITEQQADEINLALDGMQSIMDGAASIDVDRHFPGLGQPLVQAAQ
jgi:hydrogenase expression/formation protein HypC